MGLENSPQGPRPHTNESSPNIRSLEDQAVGPIDIRAAVGEQIGRIPRPRSRMSTKGRRIFDEQQQWEAVASRFDRIEATQRKWAIEGITKIFGVSREDAARAVALIDVESQLEFHAESEQLARAIDQKQITKTLADIRKEVGKKETWLKQLLDDEVVRAIVSARLDYEEIGNVLREIGAPVDTDYLEEEGVSDEEVVTPEAMERYESLLQNREALPAGAFVGSFYLSYKMDCVGGELLLYPSAQMKGTRAILDGLEKSVGFSDKRLTLRMRDDLYDETDNLVMIPISIQQQLKSNGGVGFAARGFLQSHYTDDLAQLFERALPAYVAIDSIPQASPIFRSHRPKEGSPFDYARGFAHRIEIVQRQEGTLAGLKELYEAVEPLGKLDLLDAVIENPGCLSLFHSAKKNTRAADFVKFLSELTDEVIQTPQGEIPLVQELSQISQGSNRKGLSGRLIKADLDFFRSPTYLALREKLDTQKGADGLLEALLVARNEGKTAVQTIVEKLALLDTVLDKDLSPIAERLIVEPDKRFLEIAEIEDADAILSALFRKKQAKPQKQRSSSASVSRLSWQERLAERLDSGECSGASSKELNQALLSLPEALHPKVQAAWAFEKGAAFRDFLEMAAQFGEEDAFQLILSDTDLLSNFLSRLKEAGQPATEKAYIRARSTNSNNQYRVLAGWLSSDKLDVLIADLSTHIELDEVSTDYLHGRTFARAIICGGQYRGAKREKLFEAVPEGVDLKIQDIFDPKFDLNAIDGDTVVIWVTSANSHSHHAAVKSRCANTGALFTYHSNSGYEGMLKKIQSLCGSDS